VSEMVDCGIHGFRPEAWVCEHIHAAGRDGPSPGFNYVEHVDTDFPDAWCDDCESHLRANGGEWNEATEKFANIVMLCSDCYSQYYQTAKRDGKVRVH